MDSGWIKLYRKSIGSRVFQNEGLWKVWTWCLLKANHTPQWVHLKTGRGSIEVKCERGQFIFGRHSAGKELNMNATTVWKRMQKLKNMKNIDIESDRQYSVITLLNMDIYQPDNIKSDSESDKQVTGKEQASDTNKKEKKEKNEKNKTFLSVSDEYRLANYLLSHIRKNDPAHKEPNLQNWAKSFDLLIRLDKKDVTEIKKLIKWCQEDDFEMSNVQAPDKLRKRYSALKVKMNNEQSKKGYYDD